MSVDKRYQVFISSTFLDLIEERQAVLKAVLELNQMPSGMELFPATDEQAWDLIKSVIDESDYYILILGGRYGSVHPDGVGYTEMEYDYALAQKKPVIALLHKSPDAIPRGKTEVTEDQWKRLTNFRDKVSSKHHCQFWSTAHDLKASVIVSLTMEMRRRPQVGWVRADQMPSSARIEEVLALRERIGELESQIGKARLEPAAGSSDLSQGEDEHSFLASVVTPTHNFPEYEFLVTWDLLFSLVAPTLLNEATEAQLRGAIREKLNETGAQSFMQEKSIDKKHRTKARAYVKDEEIDTCLVQFRALGMITESQRKRSVTDVSKYWALTPYGDHKLNQLRAIRRVADDEEL